MNGTIKDGKIVWLAKDVRAIKGGFQGGDNEGVIGRDKDGDRLDFTWRLKDGRTGTFVLRLKSDK